MVDDRPVVFALTGPTASGKTDASIAVAERFGATILSADAMQVYRGMDIGTGKVTPEQRARVPHEGLDLVDPDEGFDALDFMALADRLIATGKPLIVCGGTSLYLRSLQRGLVNTPPVDPALRAEIEAMPDMHGPLAQVDPVLAARLHPNDRVRLLRGLEVFRQTGQRLSELQEAHAKEPDRVRVVGLRFDRDHLDPRIDARVLQMVEEGYVDEVRRLLDRGYTPDLKPMRSLGYRHLSDHLLHGLPLEEAIRRTQRDTRSFARKQRTWANHILFPQVTRDHLDVAMRAAEAVFGG